jgi:NADH-quinone oxidoreductase subunit J
MELLVFLIFAFLALASSLVVVAHKNPVYSTMALVVTLFSVAVLFVLLGAPFIGVLQVLIYTGAIVVLFLFVIMLLNVGREESQIGSQKAQLGFSLLGAVLFGGLVIFALSGVTGPQTELSPEFVSLENLARMLFRDYLLPFEIIGLLLLVAVIGATVLARRPPAGESTAGFVHSGFEPRVDAERSTPHVPEEETVQ